MPPTSDPGSVPVVGTWVEFVVGSVLALGVFFRVLQIFLPSRKTNTSKFQFDLDVNCSHMSPWLARLGDYSSHYDVKFDLPFFFTSCVRDIFFTVFLFQFTRYLHCLASLLFSIYMIFTGFGPPNLHVIYRV